MDGGRWSTMETLSRELKIPGPEGVVWVQLPPPEPLTGRCETIALYRLCKLRNARGGDPTRQGPASTTATRLWKLTHSPADMF
jgi:hypothetical protein